MVQAIPTEQYLTSYVVLVPGTWVNDYVVLVRKLGSTVLVDNATLAATWNGIGTTEWKPRWCWWRTGARPRGQPASASPSPATMTHPTPTPAG
jgi:hypothetical protein